MDETMKMSYTRAVMICEGAEEVSSETEFLEAWQTLVDSGIAWQLQGYFGRTAQLYIDKGLIKDPRLKRDKFEPITLCNT